MQADTPRTEMNHAEDFRRDLERTIRAEARYGWDKAHKQWGRPLPERVSSGRAIGGLKISSIETLRNTKLVHFYPSEEDMALFREDDRVRLSLNDPNGDDWISAVFLGLTEKGLSVTIPIDQNLYPNEGWTLDETMIDLSDFYLKALDEMAATLHGRDAVLPALLSGSGDEIDFESCENLSHTLSSSGLDEFQTDGVAMCLSAQRFHLIQGPPGTGKTLTLAKLVHELIGQGQRVLVTSFTHRAIHHALRKVSSLVTCPIFKVSIPFPNDSEGIEFKDSFADTGLLDHSGPYVIGATPFALFSSRASEARFDVAVIDETSQMRVEAAIMPMLRAQRWFFFGDRQQLPPVAQRPMADPAEDSVFACLARNSNHTMLKTTYRMNDPLAHWPSENFYQGELVAARPNGGHRFYLKSAPAQTNLLGPEPSLVRVEVDHEGNRVSSPEEADETAALIEQMLEGGLSPTEIGVVVPFRAQAARIRKLLRFKRFSKWPDIHKLVVDTVERFQGQEREAMIVSFVVSDIDFMDRLASFLTYPQRLNVAITRARTKVILIHSTRFYRWLERNSEHHANAALARSLLQAASR